MYTSRPDIYDEIHQHLDYSSACKTLLTIARRTCPAAVSLLDVGCGTGRHLRLMQPHFGISGLDINPRLLDIARTRLGDSVSLHIGDMADFSLDESFDIITCLFGSITFVVNQDRLQSAIASMARHLSPNGVLFIESWLSPDQYWRNNVKLNVSETSTRKVAWMYVGRENANVVTNEMHFLIGETSGVTHHTEVHQQGLFSDADYRLAFGSVGLVVLEHDAKGLFGYGLYVVTKAA